MRPIAGTITEYGSMRRKPVCSCEHVLQPWGDVEIDHDPYCEQHGDPAPLADWPDYEDSQGTPFFEQDEVLH